MTILESAAVAEAGDAPRTDDRWLAIYVFYTGNARPLLTDCVKPLFERLSAEGMLSGYFFLHYWLEGPHVRVRFKPTEGNREAVMAAAEAAVGGFLKRRPSLYEVKSDFYVGLYNTLFELEFDADGRAQYLGEDGRMRLRKNNSFSWEAYEPEYDKYGGPVGVELAEWHFAQSSDLVLDALVGMNVHMRTVQLGLSVQLMMVMSAVFLDDDQLAEFFEGYRDFWYNSFRTTDLVAGRSFDRGYESMAGLLTERFTLVRSAVRAGRADQLPGALDRWAEHCTELRRRVTVLSSAGRLVFREWEGTERGPVTDPEEALLRLLWPCMHMTNNRLHITITDEAYLAHVLVRALQNAKAAS